MNAPARKDQLLRRTLETRRRQGGGGGGHPPRPGELFVTGATAEFSVEWLVLGEDPENRRVLVVPADLDPKAGPRDVVMTADSRSGSLTARCGLPLWIDAETFDPALRTGALAPEDLERARRRRTDGEAVAGGTADPIEPEYDDLVHELERACEALGKAPAGRAPASPTDRRPPREPTPARRPSARRWAAVAATAAVFLALVAGLWTISTRFTPRPVINVPIAFLPAVGGVRGGPKEMRLPAGASHLLLVLEAPEPYDAYRLTILAESAAGPKVVWAGDRLAASELSELTVALPARLFPAGDYRLLLDGAGAGDAEFLAEHLLRVEAGEP